MNKQILLLLLIGLVTVFSAAADPSNLTVVKTASGGPSFPSGVTVAFTLNVTNFDSSVNATNFTLTDRFDSAHLTFVAAEITPTSATAGNLTWILNFTANSSTIIRLNFTAGGSGNSLNNVTLFNSTGTNLSQSSFNYTITQTGPQENNGEPFNFSAFLQHINGSIPTYINATISVENETAQTITVYSNVSIDPNTGQFNITNVTIPTGLTGQLVIYAYADASRSIPNAVSPLLFPMDQYFYENVLFNKTIYLTEAVTLNISAINATGGSINFSVFVTDSERGYPVSEDSETIVYDKLVTVPASKSYFVQIMPHMSPPTKVAVTDLSDDAGTIFEVEVNTSFGLEDVYGYFYLPNGSLISSADNLSVMAFEIAGSNRIPMDGLYPQNLCSFDFFDVECGTIHNDTINASAAFYNISTPSTGVGTHLMWVAFVKYDGIDYVAYANHTTVQNGGPYNFNFSLVRMYGTSNNFVVGNDIEDIEEASIVMQQNVTTTLKQITIFGASQENSSQNATLVSQDVFVEITTRRNNETWIWMADFNDDNQGLSFFFPVDMDKAKIQIYSSQYAPKSGLIARDNDSETLELKSFEMFDFDENGQPVVTDLGSTQILLKFYRANGNCSSIYPDASCDLTEVVDAADFNPLEILVDGDVRFDMRLNGSTVKLAFFGADLSGSGPPDAIMDGSPLEGSTTDGELWQFGSFAPEIYDYVYVLAPINTSLYDVDDDNFSVRFQYLYNETWGVIWNSTAGDNDSNLPTDYEDFLPEYRVYFNGSAAECVRVNSTDLNVTPSELCYFIEDQNVTAFKLKHFSGMAPLVRSTSTGTQSNDNSNNNGNSNSGSSGGSGGGGSGGGVVSTPGANVEKQIKRLKPFVGAQKPETFTFGNGADVAVTAITVKTHEDVLQSRLTVEKLKSRPDGLPSPVGNIYQFIEINQERLGQDVLEEVHVTFSVSSRWLAEEGLLDEDVALLHWSNEAWQNLPTELVEAGLEQTTYRATTPHFSTFAIGVKQLASNDAPLQEDSTAVQAELPEPPQPIPETELTPETESQKRSVTVLLLPLVIIGLLAGALLARSFKHPKK